MATDSGTTLYSGSLSDAIIYKITRGVGMEWKDYVSTEEVVGEKPRALKRIKHSGTGLQGNVKAPRTADMTGSSVFSERQLVTTSLFYGEELDIKDFQKDFVRFQPDGRSIDLNASREISDAARDSLFEYLDTEISLLHSSGVAGAGSYDGFETIIEADGQANKVGAGTVITDGNVVDRVNALVDAIPRRLHRRGNLIMHCSENIARRYARQIVLTQNYEMANNGEQKLFAHTAEGTRIEMSIKDGLSDDFAFVTPSSTDKNSSNLVQGVWMDADSGGLSVYKEQPADQILSMVWRADFGVQYKASEDIYYITATV